MAKPKQCGKCGNRFLYEADYHHQYNKTEERDERVSEYACPICGWRKYAREPVAHEEITILGHGGILNR